MAAMKWAKVGNHKMIEDVRKEAEYINKQIDCLSIIRKQHREMIMQQIKDADHIQEVARLADILRLTERTEL